MEFKKDEEEITTDDDKYISITKDKTLSPRNSSLS
jgi:hypothetical protein